MTDMVTFGETMLRLSPPDGERLATAEGFDVRVGGAESNVAVAAANLGADAVWLSRLPDSPLGRRVVRELRGHGVRTGVDWDEGDDARLGTYYLERGGEPRGSDVIYDRGGSSFAAVDPAGLPGGVVENATFFFVSGITPALSDAAADATAHYLRTAGGAGTTTVMDLNYRAKLWDPKAARRTLGDLFADVDVLLCAQRDAREVLDVEESDTVEIAHALRTDHDFETVVLTRGAHGAVAIDGGEVHEQPAFATETRDAVGTGDAFAGGYLMARSDGMPIDEALGWGAATAALKRTLAGDAAVVTREEVEAVLADETETLSR